MLFFAVLQVRPHLKSLSSLLLNIPVLGFLA